VSTAYVPLWIVVVGGVGIDCGLAVLGYKVIKTVGEDIVKLTYTRGFAAQLGAATTVTLATIIGLPISTTSVLVGAIAGTGVIRGDRKDKGIHKWVLGKIIVSWILTFVVGYCLCIVIFFLLRFAFV